jgi:hypothetical protein
MTRHSLHFSVAIVVGVVLRTEWPKLLNIERRQLLLHGSLYRRQI